MGRSKLRVPGSLGQRAGSCAHHQESVPSLSTACSVAATVGFILQLIPSALQDDCESIKIVFPFSPEKSHGQKNLAGHSPKGCKESDKTERLSKHTVKRERTFTSMKYRPFLLI